MQLAPVALFLCAKTGIISSALITIPYNALEIMVRDREDRVDLDMRSTPVKRFEIILSYFCASVVSAFMQTMICNLRKIKSVKAESNARLRAVLLNGEVIVISRSYVKELKKKLGL